jgi:hypothetical protein
LESRSGKGKGYAGIRLDNQRVLENLAGGQMAVDLRCARIGQIIGIVSGNITHDMATTGDFEDSVFTRLDIQIGLIDVGCRENRFSDEELAQVNLRRAKFHGDWNYSVIPSKRKKLQH